MKIQKINPQEQKKLEQKILNILKKTLKKNDKIILGMSGGPDSVFLYHFLKQIPNTTILAHINHNLRGKESDKDQKFIEELEIKNINTNKTKLETVSSTKLKKQNIIEIKNIDLQKISKEKKQNLEDCGRQERYKFFTKLAKKHQASYILTAHHANDNLESIILHFSRGATIKGLTGIAKLQKLESKTQNSKNIYIFRPLLEISKAEILAYLKEKQIPYREDKSNTDTKYKRNLIRHEIIPKLQEINPSIIKTIANNKANLTEIQEFLETSAKTWIKQQHTQSIQSQENNTTNTQIIKYNVNKFNTQATALKKQIILEIYKEKINNTENIQSKNLAEVCKLIEKNIGNKKKKLEKLTFHINHGDFWIE